MALGDIITQSFIFMGPMGVIVALYFIFLIDGMIFPMLPEFFVLIFFLEDPTWNWGIILVITATVGATSGNALLYFIVSRIGMPKFIGKHMKSYTDMLFVSDEKLILVNRIAPVVPFVGAFISVCNWNLKKALSYVAIGGFLKYLVLVALASTFYQLYDSGTARTASMILIITIVVVSLIASQIQKRRMQAKVDKARAEGKIPEHSEKSEKD